VYIARWGQQEQTCRGAGPRFRRCSRHLKRERAGGKVSRIEKKTKGGTMVYSTVTMVDGIAYDITVAKDGTVIA
jgi:hypothetical protein